MTITEQVNQIRAFMAMAKQDMPSKPTMVHENVMNLRLKLHHEEAVIELSEAYECLSLVKVLDSICDSLVVVLGTAVAFGFTAEQVQAGFQEVMRSNMSKFIDGHMREDGKWEKGPSYSKADLTAIVEGK